MICTLQQNTFQLAHLASSLTLGIINNGYLLFRLSLPSISQPLRSLFSYLPLFINCTFSLSHLDEIILQTNIFSPTTSLHSSPFLNLLQSLPPSCLCLCLLKRFLSFNQFWKSIINQSFYCRRSRFIIGRLPFISPFNTTTTQSNLNV